MIASIILVFYFLNFISLETAIASLYVSALLLFIAEVGITSMGLLTLNALLAVYAGYALQTGHTMFLGVDVGWSLLFGIAIVEFGLLFAGFYIWRKLNELKTTTGIENMIGQKAEIVNWNGTTGKVTFEGELWQAKSTQALDFNPKDKATIKNIEKMTLIIES